MTAIRRSHTDGEEARRSRTRRSDLPRSRRWVPMNVRRRGVDQVPAVYVGRVSQVKIVDAPPLLFVGLTEPPDEDDQRRQTLLVDGAVQQVGNVFQVQCRMASRDGPDRRHPHAEEDVTFAVSAGTRLEEPLELRRLL
jgi:hypothetical protein